MTDNRKSTTLTRLKLQDPLLGHNLPESAAWLIVSLMELQAAFQDLQHLAASLNARELLSQTRMPAQFAPNLDPVALYCWRKGPLRAGSNADAAGQAAFWIDHGHTIKHLYSSLPAGLDTLSASRASLSG